LYSQLCCSLHCYCAVVGLFVQPVVLQFALLLCSGGAICAASCAAVCTAAVQRWGYLCSQLCCSLHCCSAVVGLFVQPVVLQFVLLLCSGGAICAASCAAVCTAAVQWWGYLCSQLCCSLYCCCAAVGLFVQPVVLQFVLLQCSGGTNCTASCAAVCTSRSYLARICSWRISVTFLRTTVLCHELHP